MLIVSKKSAESACSGSDHLFFLVSPKSMTSAAEGVRQGNLTLFSPVSSKISLPTTDKSFPPAANAIAGGNTKTAITRTRKSLEILTNLSSRFYGAIDKDTLRVLAKTDELPLGIYEKSKCIFCSGDNPAPRVRFLMLPSWS